LKYDQTANSVTGPFLIPGRADALDLTVQGFAGKLSVSMALITQQGWLCSGAAKT